MLYGWRTNAESICFWNMFLWISECKITFISWSFLQGLLVELLSHSVRRHEIPLAAEYDLIWSRLTVLSSGNIIKSDTGSQIGSATWGSNGATLGRSDILEGVANRILWGPAWACLGCKEGERNAKDWQPSVLASLSFVEIKFTSADSAVNTNVQLWRFTRKSKRVNSDNPDRLSYKSTDSKLDLCKQLDLLWVLKTFFFGLEMKQPSRE